MVIDNYFEIGSELAYRPFKGASMPWDPLRNLKGFLADFFAHHPSRIPAGLHDSIIIKGQVYIEDGVVLEEGTFIAGPTIVCSGAEVRFGAYIRGYAVIGEKAVVGHDSEVKHSLLLPGAKAAHFAYVGDSVLGREVNLGAGTKLANVRIDMGKSNLKIGVAGELHDTGLRKLGAILGDGVSLGCNSVTNPGTLIGRRTLAYALSSLSGIYPPNSVIKHRPNLSVVPRRL